MSETVREIAKELHLSKQAIYQRINSIDKFREKYTTKVGNRIEINDNGKKLLSDTVNQNNKDFHQLLDETNDVILKELKVKNEQLKTKDKQIFNLQKALDQQQQLQLQTENRADNLEKRLKKLGTDVESNVDDSVESKHGNADTKENVSWWKKLFKR